MTNINEIFTWLITQGEKDFGIKYMLPVSVYICLAVLFAEVLFIRYLFFIRPTEPKNKRENWLLFKIVVLIVSSFVMTILAFLNLTVSSIIKLLTIEVLEEALIVISFVSIFLLINYIIYRISLLRSISERGVNKRGKNKNK